MTNKQFKKKCKELFKTQPLAAFYFGVNYSTLKRWKNGSHEIPKTAIIALNCLESHGQPRTGK